MEPVEETSTDLPIDTIIKDNMRFRFQLELSQTQDQQRKDQINKILDKLYNTTQIETKPNKLQKMFEQLDIEIYKQPWSKLKLHQREVKLREYIEEKYNTEPNKQTILTTIIDANNNKQLSASDVVYNTEQSKITELSRLQRNEQGVIELIQVKKKPKSKTQNTQKVGK